MAKRKAIPPKLRDELLIEARHRCCLCPEHPVITNAHHIIKVSEGGPDTKENLVLVCGTCHDYIHRIPNLYTAVQLREYKRRWIEYCWPRTDQQIIQDLPIAPSAALVSLAKLPVTDPNLFGRDNELAILDAAWADPHTHIVAFIAFGGIGKSALVNHWLQRMAKDDYRGARRVFGWSFYSQGTTERTVSPDQFIDVALRFFSDPKPEEGSPWDKGQRLARLIRKERTLLILDGLEPLQWGPGQQHGEFRDRAGSMFALLHEFSYGMDGMCILSSHIDLTDLSLSDTSGPARRVNLERLSSEAGRALLKHHGIKGLDSELDTAVEEFGGHALALVLLVEHLNEFGDGDIAKRREVPLLDEETRPGRHAFRVMEAYDIALKREGRQTERAILRIIGLFDRPADKGCLDALRHEPVIPGVTDTIVGLSAPDWKRCVSRLRKWRLLSLPYGKDDGSLDAHPLVREWFGRKLAEEAPEGYRKAHGRLYRLLESASHHAGSVLGLLRLFQAANHGCRAGMTSMVLKDLYWPRIHADSSLFRTGNQQLHSAHLVALSHFFIRPWTQTMILPTRDEERALLSAAAFSLYSLGHLQETCEALRAIADLPLASDHHEVAMPYSNLAEVSLAAGDLAEARSAAKGARDSADLFPDRESRFYRVEARSLLASALFAQGHLRESLQEFRAAVRKQQEYAEASPSVERVLAGVRGFRLGELLFSLGGRPQSWDCSLQLIHTPGTAAEPLTSAFNRLSIGRIRHAASLRSGHTRDKAVSPVECVLPHFCAAISIIRACGRHAHLAQALLVRAYAYLHFGDRDEAYRDLKEALDLSSRIGLRLHETDARLLEGHLALDLDPPDAKTATDSLKRADTLVQETGYHLRDADLLILEGRLLAKQGDKEAGRARLEEAIHVAKREEKDGCVYQLAVDQAERYLREMGVEV